MYILEILLSIISIIQCVGFFIFRAVCVISLSDRVQNFKKDYFKKMNTINKYSTIILCVLMVILLTIDKTRDFGDSSFNLLIFAIVLEMINMMIIKHDIFKSVDEYLEEEEK